MTIGDFNALPAATIANIVTLQNREQRASVIGSIKAFADAPAPISPDQIHQLFVLENSLYPVIQADKNWFFANIGKTAAIQFARDLHVMHSVAAKTLEMLVARRGEWSQGEADPLLQRVIAFALYHQGAAIKWSFFRHEPVKPTIWPELHKLYLFADNHGFAASPLSLFAAEGPYKISVLSLYLRALMLDVLNTGSLTMPQIEIADGWLAEWTTEYVLEESYSQRSHALFVDLERMAGLQLVTGNITRPSYRYVRVDGLKEQVESVRAQLRTGNPYLGRGAPNLFSIEEHVSLLSAIERLYTTLLQASASRIEERKTVSNLLADVRLGFDEVRRIVSSGKAASAAGAGPELSLLPNADRDQTPARWKIHDMSSKGIGMMVDRVTGERASVGQLLAIRPDGFTQFMLGVVVRKLTQRALGETLLGVELLSYRPLPITLYRYAHPRDAMPDAASAPIDAIYVPGRDREGKADILVLPSGDFGLKNVFSLPTSMVNFRVRINRVLRKGGDWVGLRFEVIGKK